MSGRLRPRPTLRADRLEELAAERELVRAGPLSAPQRHWRRALEFARPEEVEELDKLVESSSDWEPGSLAALEGELKVLALQERIMHRSAPSLAATLREQRDLLARALRRYVEEAKRAADPGGPEWWPALREVFWTARARGASDLEAVDLMSEERCRREDRQQALTGLLWQREQAVRCGAEPVGNPETALRLVEEIVAAIDDGVLDDALNIVTSEMED